MEFYQTKDSIEVHKENGTDVNYFIFNEYEIHYNKINPHTCQEWHFHSQIEETLLVTKGELICYWIENGEKKEHKAVENEIIRVKNYTHTFANESDNIAEFTVFRFVHDGVDKRDIIKSDKTIVNIN